MEVGFEKATNQNLPEVDMFMVADYFKNNPDFQAPEVRNVKTSSAARESYGDNAIGYVQLKRENNICQVRAKVTPEHRVHQTAYVVRVTVDEERRVITNCKCESCPASEGGCKHDIAVLFWLQHWSAEPSVTLVECYWKSSKLSKVGTSLKFINVKDLSKKGNLQQPTISENFFKEAAEEAKQAGCQALIFEGMFGNDPLARICLHQASMKSKSDTPENFIEFLQNTISDKDCEFIEKETKLQGRSPTWYKVRYGRITASIFHEAAKCQTMDGSLLNKILGANRKIETPAMARGKALEDAVLNEVISKENLKSARKCGMYLNKEHAIFGASPDAITDTHVIEIKCPYRETTIKNYYDEKGTIAAKPLMQIQLQMFLTGRKLGYFCVAQPDFETSKNYKLHEVKLNEVLINENIEKAEIFWKRAVFPRLR